MLTWTLDTASSGLVVVVGAPGGHCGYEWRRVERLGERGESARGGRGRDRAGSRDRDSPRREGPGQGGNR
jgi:hypothetical protein